MATKVAQFKKVSYEQFNSDWIKQFGSIPTGFYDIYENIIIPKRATEGSAGYDFYTPIEIELNPNQEITIPTGIRCEFSNQDYALFMFPKSGLGFKFYSRLANSVGIIDSDYYYSDNEGHIMIKIRNDGDKVMTVKCGKGFVQGIFLQYGITSNDNQDEKDVRNGGFGSTSK